MKTHHLRARTAMATIAVALVAPLLLASPARAARADDPDALEVLLSSAPASDVDPAEAQALAERVADSPDPEAAIIALSADDQSLLAAAILPAGVRDEVSYVAADPVARSSSSKPSGVFSPMATGCWVATGTRTWVNVVGASLYSITLSAKWCASGGTVTSASRVSSAGQTYWPGWSHVGRVGGASGVVSNISRTYVQHTFRWAPAGGTILEYSPCFRHSGSQAGTTSSWGEYCTIY